MAQEAAVGVQDRIDMQGAVAASPGYAPEPAIIDSDHKAEVQRKPWLRIVAPVVALVLVATAATLYQVYAGWESTDDAQIEGYINPVSSRVSGYVTKVYVDDNQYVKAGTLLVEIDPNDYRVALESAKASLANDEAMAAVSQVNVPVTSINTASQIASAQADVSHARAGESASEKQLTAAQASLVEAQANYAKAQ